MEIPIGEIVKRPKASAILLLAVALVVGVAAVALYFLWPRVGPSVEKIVDRKKKEDIPTQTTGPVTGAGGSQNIGINNGTATNSSPSSSSKEKHGR